jgi:hypothetical protein
MPCQEKRSGTRRAGCGDDVAVDRNRLQQHEVERLTGFALVGRKRRRKVKADVRSGGYLLRLRVGIGGGDRRRD